MPGISAAVAPSDSSGQSVSKIASMFQSTTESGGDGADSPGVNRGRESGAGTRGGPRSRSLESGGMRKAIRATNPLAADADVKIVDNKSKFSSTRALFENLDKQQKDHVVTKKVEPLVGCSPLSPKEKAPVVVQQKTRGHLENAVCGSPAGGASVPAPFRSPGTGGSSVSSSPRSPPPPVPPKPARLTGTAGLQPSEKVASTKTGGSMGTALDEVGQTEQAASCSRRRSLESVVSGENVEEKSVSAGESEDYVRVSKEDSPLTEMTKRFNDLVSDLEKMTTSSGNSPNSGGGACVTLSSASADGPTGSPKYFLNKGCTTTTTAATTTCTSAHTTSSPTFSRYPRLTQTLNMEKSKQPPPHSVPASSISHSAQDSSNTPMSKPSSLYEPYWRQHSWYKRRYGSCETSPEPPPEHSSDGQQNRKTETKAARNFEFRSERDSDKEISATSKESVSATTYGLFRTRKISEQDTGSSSDEKGSKKEVISGHSAVDHISSIETDREPVKLRQSDAATVSYVSKPSNSECVKEGQSVLSQSREDDACGGLKHVSVSNGSVISETKEDVRPLSSHLHLPQDVDGSKRLSACSVDSAVEQMLSSSSSLQSPEKCAIQESVSVLWFEDGHFMLEITGLSSRSTSPLPVEAFKQADRVKFSTAPIRVYSTHSVVEYDRRNEEIDPVSASAEYELERRLEKMDIFDVELEKGCEGLGFSIIGMGVGADAGLEKLGIFVKSITPGGAVHKDGRIQVCDQIVEVDNQSLVGVTQAFAAAVLRSTSGRVNFRIGREKNLETSEIAMLIRQSIEQDRIRAQQQDFFQQLHRSPGCGDRMESPRMSQDDGDETSSATPTPSVDGEDRNGSVFDNKQSEDATPEPLVENQPQIDNLMIQLRRSDDSEEEEEITPLQEEDVEVQHCGFAYKECRTTSNDMCRKADSSGTEAFHSEPLHCSDENFTPLSGEMSQILAESLQDSVGKMQLPSLCISSVGAGATSTGQQSSGESSPASSRKSAACSMPYAMEEKEIQAKIKVLESQLADTKHQTSHFQELLSDSQVHYSDLEKKYQKAKKMLKDYQDRERDLLEREETHLKQLKEKDQQYSLLVKQLKDKIFDLESQLQAAHRKRASIVEAQLSDLNEQATKRLAGVSSAQDQQPSSSAGVRVQGLTQSPPAPTDISPALAYQPSKKVPTSSSSVPDSVDKLNEGHRKEKLASFTFYSLGRGVRPDLGVPETELLDNTCAKSKAEAVKQSQMMAGRQLPTKRAETEVLIVCHHTVEHAEAIRSHAGTTESGVSESGKLEVCKPENGSSSSFLSSSPAKSSTTSAGTSPAPPRKIITPGFILRRHLHKDLEATREAEIPHALEVMHWSCDDVCKFLKALGLEKYTPEFTVNKTDGCKFLQLDGARLKTMGVQNYSDRSLIKKRIKEIKCRIEKERKAIEKESRQMAKLEKKTSKRR